MQENRIINLKDPTHGSSVYPQVHSGCHVNIGDNRYEGKHISLVTNTYKVIKYPVMNVPEFTSTNYWAGGLIVTPDKKYMLIFYVGGEIAIYERTISLEDGSEDYTFVAKANLASYTGNHDTHHANCASLISYAPQEKGAVFIAAVSKDSKGQSNDLVFEMIVLSDETIKCTNAYTITHDKSVHYDWVVDVNQNMAIGFSLNSTDGGNNYTMTYKGYDLSSVMDDIKSTSGGTTASTSLPTKFDEKTFKLPTYQGAQGACIVNNMFFFLTDKGQKATEWYLYVFDWESGDVLSRFTFDNSHEEEHEDISIVDNSIYRSVIYRTSDPKKMWVERIILD